MTVLAYVRGGPGAGAGFAEGRAKRSDTRAIETWVQLKGLTNQVRWFEETDLRRPSRLAERAVGRAMLEMAAEADILLFAELAAGFDLPSDALALIQHSIGRNIVPYILDLSPEPAAVLVPALRATAAAYKPLEQAVRETKALLADVQANAEKRLAVAQKMAVNELMARFGPPQSLTSDLPPLGDVFLPAASNGVSTASLIKQKREQRGLTQATLAKAIGATQPSITRIENGDASPELTRAAFDYLFNEGASPSPGGEQ